MQKITFIKNYNGHEAGDTISVRNNIAHGLIDRGIAMLSGYKISGFSRPQVDKMMRPDRGIEKKRRRSEKIRKRKQTFETK